MTAELRQVRTDAELALSNSYVTAKQTLPGDGKVVEMREAAFRRFEAQGLPNRRVEEWKYTDLRALMREALPLAGKPDAGDITAAKTAGHIATDLEARRLVFVNGMFVPEISDLANLEAGLTIRPMADALASGNALVAAYLGKIISAERDSVVALNTALMRDGALIHVAAGATVQRPIHLVFTAPAGKPASIFTRSLAVIEKGARAMLLETHECAGMHQVNSVLELAAGDDAHVDHVKIFGGQAAYVTTLMAKIGAHARFNDFSFVNGVSLVRNQLLLRFEGEGTLANIRGASLLKGSEHADTTLVADHAASGCQSREVFKTVLDGKSRGVFQGKIIVRPGAQKTDAKMMTNSLLLSDEAEANQKPELEIFADDVQCGHGATSGALDQNLKFYLMARGIPEVEAEALLVQAFVGDAVEGIEHAGLRDALMEDVAAWLKSRGGA